METVAIINEILRGSYTEYGILRWWMRERYQLDGRTPYDVFTNDGQEGVTRVLDLARAG